MIKENQRMLNYLNVLLDGLIVFLAMPVSFWIRFSVLDGTISISFSRYLWLVLALVPVYLFTFAAFGLYESFRKKRLYQQLAQRIFQSQAQILHFKCKRILLVRCWRLSVKHPWHDLPLARHISIDPAQAVQDTPFCIQ